MPCKGLHCGGCHDGGGAIIAVAVVVLVLGAALAKPAEHAVRIAGHVAADVLEVVLIALVAVVAIAAAAALAWAGVRVHRRYTNRAAAADSRSPDQPIRVVAEVVRAGPQAIEAPKPRLGLHLVSEDTITEGAAGSQRPASTAQPSSHLT
jgi:hypothetical protein